MRHILSIIAVLFASAICLAEQSTQRTMPTQEQVNAAIQEHKIIDGMTLRQANQATGARPKFFTQDGKRTATWVVDEPEKVKTSPTGNRVRTYAQRITWHATVDSDAHVWNVTSEMERVK